MPKINREEYETLKELNDKWKWIATDGDGYVWGYENRPKKLGGAQLWDYFNGGQYKYFGPNLFQFIQWEDEEPYSIDELIDEYEEATRTVKKDREWLKEALFALRMTGKPENYRTERERELGRVGQWAWNNCIDRVYELAEELDEPEVLSEEFIDQHAEYYEYVGYSVVPVDDLQNLLVPKQEESEAYKQIDKLANFIMNEVEGEPSQSEGAVDTAIRIIKSYQNQGTLSQDWISQHAYAVAYDGMPDDTEVVYVDDLQNLLMPEQKELEVKIQGLIEKYEKEDGKHSNPENAWIDEFIIDLESLIEKEPKYYVDLDTAAYVALWVENGRVQIYTDSISGDNEYELHLTKQEIKDYDPRFWLFAVEVEELGE